MKLFVLLPHLAALIWLVFAFSSPVSFLAASRTVASADEETLGPSLWPPRVACWWSTVLGV